MPTPVLVQTGERLGQPLMTWHPEWVQVLADFAAASPGPTRRVDVPWYNSALYGICPDDRFDLDTLPADVADAVRAMGRAMWEVDVTPSGGFAHLERMTQPTGEHTGAFIAALKDAVIEASGEETVGMKVPIGMGAGIEDGSFPIHTDIWPARYLMNVFNRPAPNHEGASIFLPVSEYEPLALAAFGPERLAHIMPILRREVPWDDTQYDDLYGHHDHPDDTGIIAATNAAATVVAYERGEGYLVDDAVWMHGRTVMNQEDSVYDRLHRLTFDTAKSFAARMVVERRAGVAA